ncbi:MAG TPA: lamin tail domain-containing protein [Myxococcota bacterium]|jgi:hypothetical protein|nr:lamin tail domain-containing protein [Myxococcota bacterium]
MNRPPLRLAPATVLLALASLPASALPLLSEVLYDATGSDDGALFVELYGTPGTSLEGWSIEGVNGADGEVTHTIPLTGSIPADGVFVVADATAEGPTAVANADLLANFDFQNGPDSVVLRDALGGAVDALGYGAFDPGTFFAGEGNAAPDGAAGTSLARVFANIDTDDNAADFALLDVPTPGVAPVSPVPEPSGAVLVATGLAGLALSRRR